MYCGTHDTLYSAALSCSNNTFQRSLNGKSSRKSDSLPFMNDNADHPETMIRRKGLSPDEIVNSLRELSENESEGGELSCSNLDSNEDIRLSESDCEESEESAEFM
ncbi:hypothetical protein TNCV_5047071 [Trichonephila clavipes]|nr:hypothetical protein TNCV_5047071 [Trichonephila clavipes]